MWRCSSSSDSSWVGGRCPYLLLGIFTDRVVNSAFQAICGVPLWISEIVPPRHRGKLSDIHAIMINIGYSIIGFVGVGFYTYDSPIAWRIPMAIALVPEVVFLILVLWLPESPRYLMAKDKIEEAWEILRSLHSDKQDPNNEFAKFEFVQIYEQMRFDRQQDTSWKLIFKRPSYRKRALISAGLSYFIMSAGIIVVQSKVHYPRVILTTNKAV